MTMSKAEYVGGNSWTPVGKCYLCDTYDEIRMVASENTGMLYAVCIDCIKAHDKVKKSSRRDRFKAWIGLTVFAVVLSANLLSVLVPISGGP